MPSRFRVKLTLRGEMSEEDVRYVVEFDFDELPWPVRFFFLVTADDRYVNVGFELGAPIDMKRFGRLTESDPVEITPTVWHTFSDNFYRYRRAAEAALRGHLEGVRRHRAKIVEGRSRSRPVIDEAFLRKVRDERKELGVSELADYHGVHRTTIWRWLERAEELP